MASENVAPHLASWDFGMTDGGLGICQYGCLGYFKLIWDKQLLLTMRWQNYWNMLKGMSPKKIIIDALGLFILSVSKPFKLTMI